MDPLAPHQYAKYLVEVLDGEEELVTFQYTAGGNLIDSGTYEDLCGMTEVSSYIQSNGGLNKLDKSCILDEKALNWTTPIGHQYTFLSTDDEYGGAFDSSLSDNQSKYWSSLTTYWRDRSDFSLSCLRVA